MKWEKVELKSENRSGHAIFQMPIKNDSKSSNIYIFGGSNEETKYFSSLNSTKITHEEETVNHLELINVKNKKPEPRERFSFTKVNETLHFLFGGTNGQQIHQDSWLLHTENHAMEWINPKVNSKTNPLGRFDHSCSSLSQNNLILFGGHDGNNFLNDVWLIQVKDEGLN
jgi:hypothetical protein